MRDICEKVEDLTVKVTSETGADGGRAVQFIVSGSAGTYKQQLDLHEGEIKWVSFPVALVNGQVVVGR